MSKKRVNVSGTCALSLLALPGNATCSVRVILPLDITVTIIKLANDKHGNYIYIHTRIYIG